MSNLRAAVTLLAESFATGVLDAIRRAPIEEILAEGKGPRRGAPARAKATTPASPRRGGRRARRSSTAVEGTLEKTVQAIVGALNGVKGGLRSEDLRAKLGVERQVLAPALTKALEAKQIRKTGEKRGTTYFAR